MDELKKDSSQDAVMKVKIHSNQLLGRVNEHGQYVLPTQVLEDLIRAKKYLERKQLDTIYLSCHLSNVEKDLTIAMNYRFIESGEMVLVVFSLIEEVYIADGLLTNQLMTAICQMKYPYSEDVMLRAFADFNVYIKDEDSGEEKKLSTKDATPFANIVIRYNIAVEKMLDKKVRKLCNTVCAKQLAFLKQSNSEYAKAVLDEIETGMEVYVTLQSLEGKDVKDINDKAMVDIINNAVEKVELTKPEVEKEEDKKKFDDLRKELFDDFKNSAKKLEEDAQEKLVKTASSQDKQDLMNMIQVIHEAEKTDQGEVIQLKDYLSPKAGQTLEEYERHNQHKVAHIQEKLSANEQTDLTLTEQDKKETPSSVLGKLFGKKDKTAEVTELQSNNQTIVSTQKITTHQQSVESENSDIQNRKIKLDQSLNALMGKRTKTQTTTATAMEAPKKAQVDIKQGSSVGGETQITKKDLEKLKNQLKVEQQKNANQTAKKSASSKPSVKKSSTKSTSSSSSSKGEKGDDKKEKAKETTTANMTIAQIYSLSPKNTLKASQNQDRKNHVQAEKSKGLDVAGELTKKANEQTKAEEEKQIKEATETLFDAIKGSMIEANDGAKGSAETEFSSTIQKNLQELNKNTGEKVANASEKENQQEKKESEQPTTDKSKKEGQEVIEQLNEDAEDEEEMEAGE